MYEIGYHLGGNPLTSVMSVSSNEFSIFYTFIYLELRCTIKFLERCQLISLSIRNQLCVTNVVCQIPALNWRKYLACFWPSTFSSSLSQVWKDRGDWKHSQPGVCSKIHLGLFLWGTTESEIWPVSQTKYLYVPLYFSLPMCSCVY